MRPSRLLLLILMCLGVTPAVAAPSPAQAPAAGGSVYLPLITNTGYLAFGHHSWFPAYRLSGDVPLNLIANPSFESTSWFTDAFGNQHPAGWTFYAPSAGQPLPFPTKKQGSNTVPAVSGGQGEYVHKFFWQLPDNERLGQPRGLILNGSLTYKVFSDHIAHALRLTQTLNYTPGLWVKVTGYLLGETNVAACGGTFEPDHFIGSVRLGSAVDTRFYNVMVTHHDVPNNERAWNKFSVTAQVPANGQLPLTVIMQSNWACPVDFFIDHFQSYETPGP